PGLQDRQSVLTWAADSAGIPYRDVIGSLVALALGRFPSSGLEELRVSPFEEAYQRLLDRTEASRTLEAKGRRFRLAQPLVAAAS
ncbi:MAG: hypothetical protein KDD47_26175, partial [Acidobacteria bacterium]|nr:hypothetical protein [Acidobacteriota bacterium]